MPFTRIAENRIREAIADGEFDHLSGAGKPLNLDEYFSMPEDLRMAYSLLKSANCAPVEVEVFKEISRLEQLLAKTVDVSSRRELQRTLENRRTQLAITLERRSASRSQFRLPSASALSERFQR